MTWQYYLFIMESFLPTNSVFITTRVLFLTLHPIYADLGAVFISLGKKKFGAAAAIFKPLMKARHATRERTTCSFSGKDNVPSTSYPNNDENQPRNTVTNDDSDDFTYHSENGSGHP